MKEKDEDTKGVSRSRNLKNRHCIDKNIREKRTNNNLKTQEAVNLARRTHKKVSR